MPLSKVCPCLLILFVLIFSTSLTADFKIGKTYHGFKLQEKRFVKEVNAECLLFKHEQSGARLLKIPADDPNKTFSIAFKTVPQSDCGTPHIMEHSVLNGSKNFPVKSPFDVLAKGSLNTFLNAMTGSYMTIYPVASMNNKDYFNLMHVYLDAVLYPLIYDDPRIFKQEGWHRELTDMDSPVVYKGVVYNEMKGAFSSPTRELNFQIYRHLFPDNAFKYSSGGYPAAIPELTYKNFLNFHRTYYHPSNSYIFLYGDADLAEELEFIDQKYLSNFEDTKVKAEFQLQEPFDEMKEVTAYYPVPEDGETENQTYLALSLVAGQNTDQALVMALQVLTDVLVNQESAPIRLALQEAGVGREVRASVDDIKQNVFQITVQNANAEDKEKFKDIVFETLKKTVEKGLDKEAVEGTINRMEFRLREGNTSQKGLNYNFQALTGWLFAADPWLSLEYEKPLAEVKKALKTEYLESIIEKYLIDNPHSLALVLEPKPGLEKENNQKITAELEEYKKKLSEEELKSLVEETQELIAYQKREDSPEALATIPLLDLKDIDPKAQYYEVDEKQVADLPTLHYDTFTNDVVYMKLFFDTRVLPEELIPYSALLAEVLASLNTENYSYGDLDKALKIHTGSFGTYLSTYLENHSDDNLISKFVVSSKAMKDKVDKMFELTGEVVKRTIYSDQERLKAVLTRHQSRLDSRVKQNGFGYTMMRLASYLRNEGAFNELTGGLDYYWFITDLVNNFDEKSAEISDNLTKAATLLFAKNNLIVGVTCSESDMPVFSDGLKTFAKDLPGHEVGVKNWTFNLKPKNEGILTASKVQYVLQGYDFKKLGYQWDGKMHVLNQILSRDYLQNQIRVIGGAYGGFSSFSPNGMVYFASYRDPNLKETIENYRNTPEYLNDFKATDTEMTRFIIGTVARLDRPLTPSSEGDAAVRYYFEKVSQQQLQRDRNAVLSTTPEDIRAMKKLVADVLEQKVYCVYGNQEKIETQQDLFDELVKLNR